MPITNIEIERQSDKSNRIANKTGTKTHTHTHTFCARSTHTHRQIDILMKMMTINGSQQMEFDACDVMNGPNGICDFISNQTRTQHI